MNPYQQDQQPRRAQGGLGGPPPICTIPLPSSTIFTLTSRLCASFLSLATSASSSFRRLKMLNMVSPYISLAHVAHEVIYRVFQRGYLVHPITKPNDFGPVLSFDPRNLCTKIFFHRPHIAPHTIYEDDSNRLQSADQQADRR